MSESDYANPIAVDVIGKWLVSLEDTRTVLEIVAEGVRRGYELGVGTR